MKEDRFKSGSYPIYDQEERKIWVFDNKMNWSKWKTKCQFCFNTLLENTQRFVTLVTLSCSNKYSIWKWKYHAVNDRPIFFIKNTSLSHRSSSVAMNNPFVIYTWNELNQSPTTRKKPSGDLGNNLNHALTNCSPLHPPPKQHCAHSSNAASHTTYH